MVLNPEPSQDGGLLADHETDGEAYEEESSGYCDTNDEFESSEEDSDGPCTEPVDRRKHDVVTDQIWHKNLPEIAEACQEDEESSEESEVDEGEDILSMRQR